MSRWGMPIGRALGSVWIVLFLASQTVIRAGELSGRVLMTDTCSPGLRPAVVFWSPINSRQDGPERQTADRPALPAGPGTVIPMRLGDLRFQSRVVAVERGGTIRFSNEDGESHTVRLVSPADQFGASIGPAQTRDFTP